MAPRARLDPDVLAFLRRATQLLDPSGGEDVDEDRQREVCGTLVEQVRGHEVASACHVFGCASLQRAFEVATDEQRASLAGPMFSAKNSLTVLTDKYGSHVAEAALAQVLPSLRRTSADSWDEESTPPLAAVAVTLADGLLENDARGLTAAMRDRYATHTLRGLLLVLSGRPFTPGSSSGGWGGGGGWGGWGGGTDADAAAPRHATHTKAPDAATPASPVPEAFTRALERIGESLLRLDDQGAEDGSIESASDGVLLALSRHACASRRR